MKKKGIIILSIILIVGVIAAGVIILANQNWAEPTMIAKLVENETNNITNETDKNIEPIVNNEQNREANETTQNIQKNETVNSKANTEKNSTTNTNTNTATNTTQTSTKTESNTTTGQNKTLSDLKFEFNRTEIYSLMVDVSQFNMFGRESKNNPNNNFEDELKFANFIIDNHINYVYIRLGGRGWGSAGNMYYDDNASWYANICEQLKVPYGFYFLDEALNSKEVTEEVEFVKAYLDKQNFKMNVLPLALDLEYQHGQGRADNSWSTRVPLINQLVKEFKAIGIETMFYANGARIETYLKSANCVFWTAMYRKDNQIPTTSYKTMIQTEQKKNEDNPDNIENSVLNTKLNKGGTETITYSNEYLDKVVGWQFTEDGATADGIKEYIDLSMMDNSYFQQFVH